MQNPYNEDLVEHSAIDLLKETGLGSPELLRRIQSRTQPTRQRKQKTKSF